MRKFMQYVFLFLALLFVAPSAQAQMEAFNTSTNVSIAGQEITAMQNLIDGVEKMAEQINEATNQMMKIGDMLICNSIHGEAATYKIVIKIKLVAFDIFISGCILYVLGFFISVIASFYMFDVAFNLSLCIVLLPLALALWPFAWTRDKLRPVVEGIAYYTGLFIFLPLGILIGAEIVNTIIGISFGEGTDLKTIFDKDQSDIIRDKLGIFSLTFLKVLLSYIVAMRIIPLMASEFCTHFFGESLAGAPLSQRMTQIVADINKRTIGKMGKYAKDVTKHQVGKKLQARGEKSDSFLGRALARYGEQMAKTKKK